MITKWLPLKCWLCALALLCFVMIKNNSVGDYEDVSSAGAMSADAISVNIADNCSLIIRERTRVKESFMKSWSVTAYIVFLLWLVLCAITFLWTISSTSGSGRDCNLFSKPASVARFAQDEKIHSKTFSIDAYLGSERESISVEINLIIKFRSIANRSSEKAIVVECGDISKVLITPRRTVLGPALKTAIIERFGSDYNRASAALDKSFSVEVRLLTSVHDSTLESRGKILLTDEIERSWYRRKILSSQERTLTDNFTVHWVGFQMEEHSGSCALLPEESNES